MYTAGNNHTILEDVICPYFAGDMHAEWVMSFTCKYMRNKYMCARGVLEYQSECLALQTIVKANNRAGVIWLASFRGNAFGQTDIGGKPKKWSDADSPYRRWVDYRLYKICTDIDMLTFLIAHGMPTTSGWRRSWVARTDMQARAETILGLSHTQTMKTIRIICERHGLSGVNNLPIPKITENRQMLTNVVRGLVRGEHFLDFEHLLNTVVVADTETHEYMLAVLSKRALMRPNACDDSVYVRLPYVRVATQLTFSQMSVHEINKVAVHGTYGLELITYLATHHIPTKKAERLFIDAIARMDYTIISVLFRQYFLNILPSQISSVCLSHIIACAEYICDFGDINKRCVNTMFVSIISRTSVHEQYRMYNMLTTSTQLMVSNGAYEMLELLLQTGYIVRWKSHWCTKIFEIYAKYVSFDKMHQLAADINDDVIDAPYALARAYGLPIKSEYYMNMLIAEKIQTSSYEAIINALLLL